MYICRHIKYLLFLSDCNKNLYFLNRLSKNIQTSNSVKICPAGDELFNVEGGRDGRTDGQKDRPEEANNRFTQFIERTEIGMTLQHLG